MKTLETIRLSAISRFELRLFLALAMTMTWLSSSVEGAGKKYALIVGVTAYRPGQPLPALPFTENDANDLAEVLRAGGYKVTLMTQTVGRVEGQEVMAPLSDFIRDQLDALLTNPNLKPDDVVIVALAGHGVQYELIEGNKKTAKFYFCPTDAEITKVRTANDITERNRILDLAELYSALNQCKAGGKLLLVDACRNDPSKPGATRSLASITLPPLPPPPGGTAVFFSCSAHQQAFEDKDLKHGVFFHHVIEALKGDADVGNARRPADGQITLAELTEHVASSTYDYVREKYHGAKQAPELKGEFRLTIPLITLPGGAATPSNTIVVKPEPTKPLMPQPSQQFVRTSGDGQKAGELRQFNKELNLMLVWCPPGQFTMGTPEATNDESPTLVTMNRGFWLGQSEVTQAQWKEVMGTEPWKGKESVQEGDEFPATYIRHGDSGTGNLDDDSAALFCQKLTNQERVAKRLQPGWKFALPTEAQWEYACRAGRQTTFSFGDDASALEEYAWYDKNAYNVDEKYAHAVGTRTANPWGLYDMHGNVWEWCADWYSDNPDAASGTDIFTLALQQPGKEKVFRGGSWGHGADGCRSALRNKGLPSLQDEYTGFRVCLTSAP